MEYKKYDMTSYDLYNIKLDRFKQSRIEINFRDNVNRDNYLKMVMLCEILGYSTHNYPKKVDIMRTCEDLYDLDYMITTTKVGFTMILSFGCNFLNPTYVKENDYPDRIVSFITDLVLDPLIKDERFDDDIFNLTKNKLITDLKTTDESPFRVASKNFFNCFEDGSPIKIFMDNYSIDEINSITNEDLYKYYIYILEQAMCDVIIEGNIDFKEINKLFKEKFTLKTIKNKKCDLYYDNAVRNKYLMVSDKSVFNQSTLLIGYNLIDLTTNEKLYAINLFEYIFCNGGFKSKLFKALREENSLCYGVSSFYMKFDRLFCIKVSLAYENVEKAISLIKKSLNEMIKGNFDDELLEESKKSITSYLATSKDNIYSYSNQCYLNIIDNFPSVDERMIEFNKVTKDEIINVSKKLKMNVVYLLKEEC